MLVGNKAYASYAVQAGEIVFVFTAPYNNRTETDTTGAPLSSYSAADASKFVSGQSNIDPSHPLLFKSPWYQLVD